MPKKKPPEHANLERWMVSYADFMTLLFAVFVVLYAFAMAKQSEAQSMAQSVASAFSENLVSAAGGVLLIPGSLEETVSKQAESAQNSADSIEPKSRSVHGGGTIMNFTSAGSPADNSPNTSGGNGGYDMGQSGENSAEISTASGDLLVSETKTHTNGSPHTEQPDGGSDSGAGGFTPGGNTSKMVAEGGKTNVEGENRGQGEFGTPFDSIRKSITESLSKSGAEKEVQIEEDENWLTLNINSGVLFAKDSASILSRARPIIARIAVALTPLNNYIRVRGYTDDSFIPDGIFKDSWQLSAQRGVNVLKELVADGIEPERMAVESYGQYHPFVSNETGAGRALNRRVVIAISRYIMNERKNLETVEGEDAEKLISPASSDKAGEGRLKINRSDDDSVILNFGH